MHGVFAVTVEIVHNLSGLVVAVGNSSFNEANALVTLRNADSITTHNSAIWPMPVCMG